MKDEKKEGIKCPACGIENPRNRLTCQICHERLIPNPKKMEKQEKHVKSEKVSRKKKETFPVEKEIVKAIEEDSFPDSTKEIEETPPQYVTTPYPSPAGAKVKRPRKKRAKVTTKESEPVFFVLQSGRLSAVHITWGVMRPIKRKDLALTERNVLSVWNRTKDLINNN